MTLLEVQMNRLGINSIELTSREVEVSPGTVFHIKITNYGAPTHVTLKTTGSEYTNFTYENIYLESEAEVKVPIYAESPAGTFPMNIISGYGMRKEEVLVTVIKPHELPPQPMIPEPMTNLEGEGIEVNHDVSDVLEQYGKAHEKLSPVCKILIIAILPIIALAFILVWILAFPWLNPIMVVSIIYAVMIAGIAITWVLSR